MEKPKWLKEKYISNIGALIYIMYAMILFFYFYERSSLLSLLLMLLFLMNIVWIFIFYSSCLKENEENIVQLRLLIFIRIVTFLGMNAFRLMKGFGKFGYTSNYLFLTIVIIISISIFFVDEKCTEKE